MPRFQIDARHICDGKVSLDKKESHHAISVLRLKTGDTVDLIDGKGHSFMGVVLGRRAGRLDVRLEPQLSEPANDHTRSATDLQITIAVSAIKPARMELLIQKACELGAHSIIPMRSERCIIKLSKERWEEKIRRWQKIAAESCKQCGLAAIPRINVCVDYKEVFLRHKDFDLILIPTLTVKPASLYDTLTKSAGGRILVLVGPEGDFTKNEVEHAVSLGAIPVTLGPLVLRTETAAMHILSVLNFFYREF